ncbi:hypothetical protein M5K25_006578 [Dendrobium thyrsiflorum]|uniref:Uncharacterized protein n=1 Tax=Dendrobium thyrsiflorum TaxID=117978 RepID=A0ABD0VC76_DENTH
MAGSISGSKMLAGWSYVSRHWVSVVQKRRAGGGSEAAVGWVGGEEMATVLADKVRSEAMVKTKMKAGVRSGCVDVGAGGWRSDRRVQGSWRLTADFEFNGSREVVLLAGVGEALPDVAWAATWGRFDLFG